MEDLYLLSLCGALGALMLVLIQLFRAVPLPKALQSIDALLRQGTLSCLWRQGVLALSGLAAGTLFLRFAGEDPLSPAAFLSGGLCVLTAALLATWSSTRWAARTAAAAVEGLSGVAAGLLSSGLIAGFAAVSIGLGGLSVWFLLLHSSETNPVRFAALAPVFALGAAFAALLLVLPGGVFSEAAALCAPTLPRDDPRNPCAPARAVGRGVGAVQGLTAGALAAYVCLLSSAFSLGARAFPDRGVAKHAVLLPLIVAGVGTIASLVGTGLLKPREVTGPQSLVTALRRGVLAAGAMTALVTAPLAYLIFGLWRPYWAILIGVAAGCALPWLADLFTADRFPPAARLAQTAKTGTVFPILDGFTFSLWAGPALAAVPLCVSLAGFLLLRSILPMEGEALYRGLYGAALAGTGFLSTAGLTLTFSAFGPTVSGAMAAARGSDLGQEVRARLEGLHALGSSAESAGRVLWAGVSVLAALMALFCAGDGGSSLPVMAGVLAGWLLVSLFCAALLAGVRRTGSALGTEIRRQFRSIQGIKDGSADPDYPACIRLCARGALLSSLLPLLLAVLLPALLWRVLGPGALPGLAAGTLVAGGGLALVFGLAGGVWGSTRRVLEADRRTEKGSEAHRSAVTADTLGRPLRGSLGPALTALALVLALLTAVLTTL